MKTLRSLACALLVLAIASPALAAFYPTGAQPYFLSNSIAASNTTIYLSSFKEPVSNVPYTMSYLNTDVIYGTLDPQFTDKAEFISCTAITQNANGSAALSGCTRGLSKSYPYTASSTLRLPHAGQAQFLLAATPQFYQEYAAKRNNETITGNWSINYPIASSSPASKGYVDAIAFGGALPQASETAQGVVELATKLEQASSTQNGSSGPLALQARYATSTYNPSGALQVVVTNSLNKIDDNFISTSTLFTNVSTFFASSSMQSYAATSTTNNAVFTYTKPAFLKYLVVEAVGGGASSGSTSSGPPGPGAGAGACYAKSVIPASAVGTTVTITVGKGGTAVSGNADGNNGNASTFGSLLTAQGGAKGNGATNSNGGVGTCASSLGDVLVAGGNGATTGPSNNNGFSGGNSFFGQGGYGAGNGGASNGFGYGSGGGAPAASGGGTAGAPGLMIITSYFY